MWIHGICCSSLFYKRGYSQNPPPVPLQEAHRPAILKLRHRPTSVQDVPTCEPLARTDHEPKAHLCMWIHGICCSSLFYKRGYSQNPPPVPLQEAHRPAILKLRHRPTSVQDVPTCEPLARTDHEPKAHLCMWIHGICCSSLFYKRGYSQNPPPVPLQEAHRPAILKLRHRPTSVQDVPTCEPLARTDHEPKAHL